MPENRKLARFTVESTGSDYILHIEADGGSVLDVVATRDQIDIIAETLDEILAEDDSADEVVADGYDDDDDDIFDDDFDDEDDEDEELPAPKKTGGAGGPR